MEQIDMSLLGDLWKDNEWVPVVAGIIGVAVTFVLGGPEWGIAGLILALLLIVGALFNSLNRARRRLADELSHSDGAMEGLDVAPRDEDESGDRVVDTASNKPQRQKPVETVLEGGADKEMSVMLRAADAAVLGNRDKVISILDPWIAESETANERLERTSARLFLLARAGDAEALDALREHAEKNPDNRLIVSHLALCLEQMGEPLQGAKEIARRIAKVSEEERPILLIQQAGLFRSAGKADRAIETVAPILANEQVSDEVKAEALEEYARSLEELDRTAEAFGYYEEAVALAPTRTSLRFDLAYKYGESGLLELAVLHYTNVVNTDRDKAAWNNLGVVFHNLGVPIEGTINYIKAAQAGNLLATSNIVKLLVEIGFLGEAKRWLSEAGDVGKVDSDIMSAAGYISQMQATERQRIPDIFERGRESRDIMKRLRSETPSALPEGTWEFSDGTVISMTIEDEVSKGVAGREYMRRQLRIRREGNLLGITLYKGEYSRKHLEGHGIVEGGKLFGYLKDESSSHPETILFAGHQKAQPSEEDNSTTQS
jgi:tetratricopeptide (TPR) repeat protein